MSFIEYVKAVVISQFFLALLASPQARSQSDLLPVYDGEKWGFVDSSGKVAISFQYRVAEPFSEGLAMVDSGRDFGYIDEHGKWAIRLKGHGTANSFSEGLAAISKTSKDALQWSYIDKKGVVVIGPAHFQVAESFSDGLALVGVLTKDEKSRERKRLYGFINREGKFEISPKFAEAKSFSDGLALVRVEDRNSSPEGYGYIDKKGEFAIPPEYYAFAGSFSEGRAAVMWDKQYGYIDKGGKRVIDYRFEEAYEFREGLALVKSDGRYGFIDTAGKFVVEPRYFEASTFSNGYAAVYDPESESGIIDTHGTLVAPFPLRWAEARENGIFFVQHSVFGWGAFVDKNGRLIYRWPSTNGLCPACGHYRGEEEEKQARELIKFDSDPRKATVYVIPIRWLDKRPALLFDDQALLNFQCSSGPTPTQCYALPGPYWALFALNRRKCKLHIEVVRKEEHKYFLSFNDEPAAACQ